MADETEKAFQKQPVIFYNKKAGSKKKDLRHHRNIGLGFKTPHEAIGRHHIDKKCPFTYWKCVNQRPYSYWCRSKNDNAKNNRYPYGLFALYQEIQNVEIEDVVKIGECRPSSKTVRINVLKTTKGSSAKKSFGKF
ncbi:hypothetical protein HHI36_014664 [Cryptolaemus montrouzieri]|uniref:Small ribosomal subunit protein uS17 N-terminal domain-containing protein n=1 Tax=Cryptolaemus montrouzieri TaxID=559131 RepID=A0ABD2N3D0_9CUCU